MLVGVVVGLMVTTLAGTKEYSSTINQPTLLIRWYTVIVEALGGAVNPILRFFQLLDFAGLDRVEYL